MASQVMFDRKWEIVLQVMEEQGKILVPTKTKSLRDLKMTFNIRNTLLGDPSLASFQIYNINSETEAMLTSHRCFITMKAGYTADKYPTLGVLFQGEITNSYEIRQGVDIVWNVWARTAFNLLNTAKVGIKSIQVPTSPISILDQLVADAVGLSKPTYVNDAESVLRSASALDEFQISGTFKQEFDDLLLPLGLGWQIQGDELLVFNQQFTDPSGTGEQAINVSRLTGLLTVPVVDYTGVNFTNLLNHEFKPTKVINVEPNTARYNLGNEFYVKKFDKDRWRANGRFRIFEVTHKGDTRGDMWESEVTAFYRRN